MHNHANRGSKRRFEASKARGATGVCWRHVSPELGADFDRGFSSGFSPPDIFLSFSIFGHAHEVSKAVTKSVFVLRKTQDKKSTSKSVANSVPLCRKIHRKIRHGHQKNPPQFHSAETCALEFEPSSVTPPVILAASSEMSNTVHLNSLSLCTYSYIKADAWRYGAAKRPKQTNIPLHKLSTSLEEPKRVLKQTGSKMPIFQHSEDLPF